jgi:PAS domain S-box-containing protein
VQFYETDTFLLEVLAQFIGAGLGAGTPCIVVATSAHREALEQRLRENGLDLDRAQAQGRYVTADPTETLARFMGDDLPNEELFAQIVDEMLARVDAGHRELRIFGEMVNLLWEQGKQSAALRLEALWNELSAKVPFTLLCAYPLPQLAGFDQTESFTHICALHSEVLPDERYSHLSDETEQRREISLLRQQALSLQLEVAERQRTEEALLHLAAIVSSSDDAIFRKDLDGIVTSWNAAAERLYGYTAAEMIGQPVTRIFPDGHDEEFAAIMERIRNGQPVEHQDTLRRRKDGSLVPVSVTVSPVKDRNGTVIGASAIAHDVSQQKNLERQRAAFISLVTHELRTPLTSLQGNIQMAQRWLRRLLSTTEGLSEEQQRLLETTLSMLSRSQYPLRVQQRLIDDLLDFSRLQEDKMELHLMPCDLVGLVGATVPDHQAAHPARLITLELPEQDPVLVFADRDRLQQVLGNYLTNALKFSPETEPVEVGLEVEESTARIWVRDHGPGLPKDQQCRIWEQFYQAPTALLHSETKAGLGLGLYVCQQLIRRQQGEVGVESEPGQGAIFWFTVPMLERSA